MILPNRKYQSGSGFALWRWTDIVLDGELYLRRLHLIQIPRVGAIMLHWIKKPDPQFDLHDHPVSFFSLVLRGSYAEFVPSTFRGGYEYRRIAWWNYIPARGAHRIIDVFGPKGVVTLVFAGPKRREWGFHTPSGWVHWRDYKGLK